MSRGYSSAAPSVMEELWQGSLSAHFGDDRFGEPLDGFAEAFDAAGPHAFHSCPGTAHHRRDADVLGAFVQIRRRRLEERQQNFERLVLASVLLAQVLEPLRVTDRVVPGVRVSDP